VFTDAGLKMKIRSIGTELKGMLIYLTSGTLSMKSKIKLSLDDYFQFLEEYFALFPFRIKRKVIKGNNFKL
jgi:hypothetical protein